MNLNITKVEIEKKTRIEKLKTLEDYQVSYINLEDNKIIYIG